MLASEAVVRGPQMVFDLWCRRLPAELETASAGSGLSSGSGVGAALRYAAERGIAPLGSLLASLGAGEEGEETSAAALPEQVWIVTEDAQRVSGSESVQPALAPWGITAAALGGRYPQTICRHLDLHGGEDAARLAEETLALVDGAGSSSLVALRNGFAWLPTTERLPTADASPAPAQAATNGGGQAPSPSPGCILSLNGLGDLGLGFSRWRASQPGARLALVESAGFPRREEWQDWLAADSGGGLVSRKIEAALDLEALAGRSGAEVRVVALDAAGSGGLSALLSGVEAALGAVEEALVVFEPEPGGGDPAAALETKAELLASLEEALAERPLRRAWLVSALPGSEGAGVDPALGAYLDAVAEARRGSVPWSSLRWSPPRELEESLFAALPRLGRLRQLVAAGSQAAAEAGLLAGLGAKPGTVEGQAGAAGTGVSYYSRPNLGVEYVAPRDETESAIAEIWRDMLGVGDVGVHDNFLELGGDSLLATRLVSRMRDAFRVDLPIRLFFEASTVAELAEAVRERQSGEEAELAALAREVDDLSEEEAELELLRLRAELGVEG
jgi:acyl carrier protein